MISRRVVLGGLAGLAGSALAGCGGRPPPSRASAYATPAYTPSTAYAPSTLPSTWQPSVPGLDVVIDISHNVTVTDFSLVRQSNILGVIHKTSEGGDWFDPSYAPRRAEAEQAGLLWGGYHFGTRQYSGAQQAAAFLSAARPGPSTLLALDLEPNDGNPANTMRLAQAEEFVRTVYQATGRLPVVYTHVAWANGERFGRRGLSLGQPITPHSILARCDLWLGDPREEPEVPYAWADRGWRLWQYVANESANDVAYGGVSRAVPGLTHCDRNLFAGDVPDLYRFWRGGRAGV
jgi:lysozyme